MRKALVLVAAFGVACGGAEFTTGEQQYFEYLTPSDSEHRLADRAVACGCEFLGSYDTQDYWWCPVHATGCLQEEQ